MSLASMLNQTCTIQRWSPRTKDAAHTLDTPSYSDLATGVRCNIQETGGTLITGPGGQKVQVNAKGYFGFGTSLRPASADGGGDGDLIVLANGAKYEVFAVVDQVGRSAFKKAFLKSI